MFMNIMLMNRLFLSIAIQNGCLNNQVHQQHNSELCMTIRSSSHVSRRQALLGLSATAIGLPAWAQAGKNKAAAAWPTQALRIVVGYPGGSSPDMLARLLIEPLSKALGQPVIVDNKPGAGGNIGVDLVAKAQDGHTIGLAGNGPLTSSKQLYSKLPYDPVKDLRPISLMASSPLLLAASASVPANTLQELMLYARNQGDKLNYGSIGAGSGAHLTMELFKAQSGIRAVHVPFQGFAQVINAMIGKQIELGFMVPSVAMAQAKAGKIKVFAVSTSARSSMLPELPSIAEAANLPRFDAAVWNGVFAPASMPAAQAQRISEEIGRIVRLPEIRQRLFDQGWQALGTAPEGLALRMKSDTALWGGVIAMTGTKLD
jgi:tripartite-type tricarboxylate transporter receptor subunit TctC